MIEWLHDSSPWLTGPLVVAAFVCIAMGGLASTRGWMRRRGVHALVDNNVVGAMFSGMLTIYAITLGLTAVASWDNAVAAADVTSLEAAELAAAYRDLEGYPEPLRSDLRRRLRGYVEHEIEAAWPSHQRGEESHAGTAKLDEFQNALYVFQPATDSQRIVHAEALDSYNRIIESRRQRLEAVTGGVPGTLWSVVLVGAALSIAASWLFSLASVTIHALMSGLLAAMIGLLVFFIAVTDRPFHGANGIGPDAYRLILRDVMN